MVLTSRSGHSSHANINLVAIKEDPTTTLNFAEIGNESSIANHNEKKKGLLMIWTN